MSYTGRYRGAVRLSVYFIVAAVGLAAGLFPTGGAALQAAPSMFDERTCEGPLVSRLVVDNRDLYDDSHVEQMGRLGWTLQLANKVHIRTRADFIRRELLFEEGGCYDRFLIDESTRLLRLYGFIDAAESRSEEQPDGSYHVTVETRDKWTTKLDLGVSFDGGIKLETIELTEENFLGRGMELEAFLQERRERRDVGFRYRTNRMLGTRADGRLELGRTRVGDFFAASLAYPFVGEGGRFSAYQTFDRKEDLFSYSLPAGSPYSNAVVPARVESFALAAAARSGVPGDLTMLALGISRESVRFENFPTSIGLIRDGDFANTLPVDDSTANRIAPQVQESWKTRINMMLGWRNLQFVERRGLDALAGRQDIQLGTEFNITFGANPGSFGSGGVDQSNDIYLRVTAFGGFEWRGLLVNTRVLVDGRNVLSGGAFGTGWQDVLLDGDLFTYLRPGGGHTVFAKVSTAGGWEVRHPFQLTLGGREGLRGYREDRYPGGRRVLATLEDRVHLGWPLPDLMDFGLTVFADVGRMWAGDAPFGKDTGWIGDVGGGLRFGFPDGSRGVIRVDVAVPLVGGGPVFRVSMKEFFGIRRGFDDEQVLRSRVLGIGADVFHPETRR